MKEVPPRPSPLSMQDGVGGGREIHCRGFDRQLGSFVAFRLYGHSDTDNGGPAEVEGSVPASVAEAANSQARFKAMKSHLENCSRCARKYADYVAMVTAPLVRSLWDQLGSDPGTGCDDQQLVVQADVPVEAIEQLWKWREDACRDVDDPDAAALSRSVVALALAARGEAEAAESAWRIALEEPRRGRSLLRDAYCFAGLEWCSRRLQASGGSTGSPVADAVTLSLLRQFAPSGGLRQLLDPTAAQSSDVAAAEILAEIPDEVEVGPIQVPTSEAARWVSDNIPSMRAQKNLRLPPHVADIRRAASERDESTKNIAVMIGSSRDTLERIPVTNDDCSATVIEGPYMGAAGAVVLLLQVDTDRAGRTAVLTWRGLETRAAVRSDGTLRFLLRLDTSRISGWPAESPRPDARLPIPLGDTSTTWE